MNNALVWFVVLVAIGTAFVMKVLPLIDQALGCVVCGM